MREDQADTIIDLLKELVDEVRENGARFDEFSGYNVYNMQELVSSVTGPLGYNLSDLNERLQDVISALSSLETSILLK
jgi:hypothetical protein